MRQIWSWLVVSVVALAGAAQTPPVPEPLRPFLGKPVPKATLIDIDNNKHSLTALRGKVVLLVYWAPH